MDFVDFEYKEGYDDVFEEGHEEGHEEMCEETSEAIEEEMVDNTLDEEAVFDPGLREASLAGALIGVGEEYGRQFVEKKELANKSLSKERPVGAIPINRSFKNKKKKHNLLPFEQWVADLISGKKAIDDEL